MSILTLRGRNLTDPLDGFLRGKRFLILDRDKKFTTEFRDLLEHAGTDVIRLPHHSPNLNAYVERFMGLRGFVWVSSDGKTV